MNEHTFLEHMGNFGVICLAVILATVVHYGALKRLNAGALFTKRYPRWRLLYGVVMSLVAHVVEIAIFACAYGISTASQFGYLEGNFSSSIADYFYFSFAAFTTVGFGDIVPVGPVRLLAGMEALTGFVLITWTASYLYIEMTRTWGVED
jgi:hypothetical protein